MAVSRRGVVALLLTGAISARAAVLSAFPGYCAKDMNVTSVPPLNGSVVQSFGGEVSLADVEILQVGVGFPPCLFGGMLVLLFSWPLACPSAMTTDAEGYRVGCFVPVKRMQPRACRLKRTSTPLM